MSVVHKPGMSGAHRFHMVVHIWWKSAFSEPFDGARTCL
jgi:hypothetical protein